MGNIVYLEPKIRLFLVIGVRVCNGREGVRFTGVFCARKGTKLFKKFDQ
jgi:hypothetical protein